MMSVLDYRLYRRTQNKNQKPNRPCNAACDRNKDSTNRSPAKSVQKNAITVRRPSVYNSLPKYLRNMISLKTEII